MKELFVRIVIFLGIGGVALFLFARNIALDLIVKYDAYVPSALLIYFVLCVLALLVNNRTD
ncbi:MAG TPA: hypothetical protein PLS49_07430 [Candidatus Woesebacteria bacterium]|nr:hypothetical protein [Candidatus Woesebacteria bacterium]